MSEAAETFSSMKEQSKIKRAANREQGRKTLEAAGVSFVASNKGAHLIVEDPKGGVIDYWPGTGLWNAKSGETGRGIGQLMSFLRRRKAGAAK